MAIKIGETLKLNHLLLDIAQNEIGVKEIPGKENNPRILEYARGAGLNWVKNDETSWCGIFMGWLFSEIPETLRPDYPKEKAATAREWMKYGTEVDLAEAQFGDVVVFWRKSPQSWKGHVGLYMGRHGDDVLCLGGNQNGQVSISNFDVEKILSIHRT